MSRRACAGKRHVPGRLALLVTVGWGFVFVKNCNAVWTWLHPTCSASRRRPLRGIVRHAEDEDFQPLDASTNSMLADWREFRARLVKQESIEEGRADPEDMQMPGAESANGEARGWAHPTALIETGSLLLSAPGDQSAINQQYFHKAIIFIIEHTENFTRGVILNRPTALNTTDLESVLGSSISTDLLNASDAWNVWCGGECQGLIRQFDRSNGLAYTCLHTIQRFAASSKEIIKGVFMIDLTDAKKLVMAGEADKDDFLLIVGYSGWKRNQLQEELDRGDTWTLAAADRQALLGRLREAQAALTRNLQTAAQRQKGLASQPLSARELGDGIEEWKTLYAALGLSFSVEVEELPGESGDEIGNADSMLQRWIERCLIPPHHQAVGTATGQQSTSVPVPDSLPVGTILRGSSTLWALGRPAETPLMEKAFGGGLPGQYLHKSVLLLAGNYKVSQKHPVMLVLLNGPQVGHFESNQASVFFGGPKELPGQKTRGVFELQGESGYRFQGVITFEPQQFAELLELGALEVSGDVKLADILRAPAGERWPAAGGELNTLREAAESNIGDMQQRRWYKSFFGIKFPPED